MSIYFRQSPARLALLLPLVCLVVFSCLFTQNGGFGVSAQGDVFTNTTCYDIGGVGNVCLIFQVEGCNNPDLVLHVNVSRVEIWKVVLKNGETFNQDFARICTATVVIANTPWVLTPTYARFSYSGNVDCTFFNEPIPATEVVLGEDCSAHTDCQSCLQSQICGWCESGAGGGYIANRLCFAENNAETQPFCGTCTQWFFNDAGKCPLLPPPVSSSSSTGAGGGGGGGDGGSTIDDVTASSSSLSTGGAVALGFALGGATIAAGVGFAFYLKWKKRSGRVRVKTDEDGVGVEMKDGQQPLNDQKSESETYEAPKERNG